MCLQNFDFRYPYLRLHLHSIHIPILYKKNHPISLKLGAFAVICSKYTQFMKIGRLRLWWKPPNRYAEIREKAPQKTDTYVRIPCQC